MAKTNLFIGLLLTTGALLISPMSANAALPTCNSAASDPDADGFGWENNQSCVVATNTRSTGSKPACKSSTSDPDGDGFGWENNQSCIVSGNSTATSGKPTCISKASDPDGDGFGWENSQSCVVGTETAVEQNSSLYPYNINSPYSAMIKRCVLVTRPNDSCLMNEIPFLGMVSVTPSVDQIMDRVVVSQDWMGERFRQILSLAPSSLLVMFRYTSAIVIAGETERSYYWPVNAAIWVDPDYLWLTKAEKDTIALERQGKIDPNTGLDFNAVTLYSASGSSTDFSLSAQSNYFNNRSFNEVFFASNQVLYHELAHAADFAPLPSFANMNYAASIFDAIYTIYGDRPSYEIQTIYPNTSSTLNKIALAFDPDRNTVITDNSIDVLQVANLFWRSGAISMYSHTTIEEDFANLVASTMLKYEYNFDTNVSFYTNPDSAIPNCSDFILKWGVRNRLANPVVAQRAKWAVSQVFGPSAELDDFFANRLGEESFEQAGRNYCNN